MDTTFYLFGVLYLRWTTKDGSVIEAVKEQVDFFGKEVFEQGFENAREETDSAADGITYSPSWEPTEEELRESIQSTYSWMRDMEIM